MRTLAGPAVVFVLTSVILRSAGITIVSPTGPVGASKLLRINRVVGAFAGAALTASLSCAQVVMLCS